MWELNYTRTFWTCEGSCPHKCSCWSPLGAVYVHIERRRFTHKYYGYGMADECLGIHYQQQDWPGDENSINSSALFHGRLIGRMVLDQHCCWTFGRDTVLSTQIRPGWVQASKLWDEKENILWVLEALLPLQKVYFNAKEAANKKSARPKQTNVTECPSEAEVPSLLLGHTDVHGSIWKK